MQTHLVKLYRRNEFVCAVWTTLVPSPEQYLRVSNIQMRAEDGITPLPLLPVQVDGSSVYYVDEVGVHMTGAPSHHYYRLAVQ